MDVYIIDLIPLLHGKASILIAKKNSISSMCVLEKCKCIISDKNNNIILAKPVARFTNTPTYM